MRKILPTGVAALLMAISAHATENPDMCAVVLKTPDGFLALRTKPEPKSKMMSKLFPGQVLRVDIDKYRRKNWIYVEGLVENSERLDGWVYSKYIQSFVCPSSLVSVRKHFESFESLVIQSGDLIREGHHRCGRRRTADVTTAANCDIRVT